MKTSPTSHDKISASKRVGILPGYITATT